MFNVRMCATCCPSGRLCFLHTNAICLSPIHPSLKNWLRDRLSGLPATQHLIIAHLQHSLGTNFCHLLFWIQRKICKLFDYSFHPVVSPMHHNPQQHVFSPCSDVVGCLSQPKKSKPKVVESVDKIFLISISSFVLKETLFKYIHNLFCIL